MCLNKWHWSRLIISYIFMFQDILIIALKKWIWKKRNIFYFEPYSKTFLIKTKKIVSNHSHQEGTRSLLAPRIHAPQYLGAYSLFRLPASRITARINYLFTTAFAMVKLGLRSAWWEGTQRRANRAVTDGMAPPIFEGQRTLYRLGSHQPTQI